MVTTIHAELDGQGRIALLAVGPDAEVALAAKQLELLTPLFSRSDPPGALLCPVTWPAVVQLSAVFRPETGATFTPGPRLCAWIEEQVRLRQPVGPALLVYTPPAGLTPYPWQVEGARMIGDLGSALVTDEPGTGKTITTILGLAEWSRREHGWDGRGTSICACGWAPDGIARPSLHDAWRAHATQASNLGPVLVICPASVIDPWVEAWRAWAPHVRAVAWRGTPAKRVDLFGTADVYVTSYETARVDAGPAGGAHGKRLSPLIELGAAALVIDECHLIKNNQSQRSQAVRRLAKKVTDAARPGGAGPVVALSGTPITHHPGDLWPTLDAISHDAWPAKGRWVSRYCLTLPGEYDDQVLGLHPMAEQEFRLTMLGQHRRVAKADVLKQLPPKVYSVRTVDMPTRWRKVYDDFEGQMLAELPDGTELSVFDQLSVLGHLRQLASAAADVEVTFGPDVDEQTGEPKRHVHLELKAPSWKVDALLELLEERPGEPVVAFAPSRQLMMLAGAAATAAGRRVGYVVGEQSAKDRTAAVEGFQSGDLDLICATTGAGGVGITLTAARTVVFLQRPWEVEKAMQAEDRCHRIGSEVHDSIEIVDVVTRDSVEDRIRARLREKAGQLADLLQDPRIVTELLGGAAVDVSRSNPDPPRSMPFSSAPADARSHTQTPQEDVA